MRTTANFAVSWLGMCTSLLDLIASDNRVDTIPNEVMLLTRLQSLRLDNNRCVPAVVRGGG